MYRSMLFTGCAAGRDGAPAVRQATIALARALRLELWEAPPSACCGAQPGGATGATGPRDDLAPLREGMRQGLDIVCLSPACCRIVAGHLAATGLDAADGEAAAEATAPHVRDLAHLLLQADGLERLARAVRTPLTPLRVALHGTCHADHWPPASAAPGMGPEQPAVAETEAQQPVTAGTALPPPGAHGQDTWLERAARWALSPRESVPAPARAAERCTEDADNTALAALLATTGATVLPDVSASGGCAIVRVRPTDDGREARAAGAGAVRCLALAAEAGADLLVTPCVLCFGDLNRYQRRLERDDPARTVPVLHLAQVLGVACGVAPLRLDLTRITASARRALAPFVM